MDCDITVFDTPAAAGLVLGTWPAAASITYAITQSYIWAFGGKGLRKDHRQMHLMHQTAETLVKKSDDVHEWYGRGPSIEESRMHEYLSYDA